ncbi:MAG TPA: hypothetical protein VE954_35235 [Oligoflexus sp.]|uniref:DUF7660 family protein n=1 Tax=Oligoflexus sp. TaxID=1971216 RepID=UPI002D51B36A|nr:hypothetical protein [Oligoflexus sp.]HYX38387.1 hypothetical protein [Oligoflexus sp.]
MMTEWVNRIDGINSRTDLVAFVRTLAKDFCAQDAGWSNRTADDYLEALAAWLDESDGYYGYRGEPPVLTNMKWRQLAEMLLAATMYE